MSKRNKYRIELEGYNDGMPYEITTSSNLPWLKEQLEERRRTAPQVRYRLIYVIEDYK